MWYSSHNLFVVIRQHLLPLTKENRNGQYASVQPIPIFFAERCIYYLLTTNISCEFLVIAALLRRIPKSKRTEAVRLSAILWWFLLR